MKFWSIADLHLSGETIGAFQGLRFTNINICYNLAMVASLMQITEITE